MAAVSRSFTRRTTSSSLNVSSKLQQRVHASAQRPGQRAEQGDVRVGGARSPTCSPPGRLPPAGPPAAPGVRPFSLRRAAMAAPIFLGSVPWCAPCSGLNGWMCAALLPAFIVVHPARRHKRRVVTRRQDFVTTGYKKAPAAEGFGCRGKGKPKGVSVRGAASGAAPAGRRTAPPPPAR